MPERRVDAETRQRLDVIEAAFKRRTLLLLAMVLLAYVTVAAALYRDHQTRKGGRAQVCGLFIRQYDAERIGLERTLKYLHDLQPAERGTSLNVAIAQGVPQQRVDIRTHVPPKICDPYRKT